MRKPRVVIFYNGGIILRGLKTFFHNSNYETFVETESMICPIYNKKESKTCAGPVPCCDIMVAVHDLESKKSVDVFSRQFQIGCKVTSRNKSIIAHAPIPPGRIDRLGPPKIDLFENPLDFVTFGAWVKDCEGRIDLTQRLAVLRRAIRHHSDKQVRFRLPSDDADCDAQAVNISSCGICLKTAHLLKRGQAIHLLGQRRTDAEEAIVQWAKKLEDGGYLVGVTFCV